MNRDEFARELQRFVGAWPGFVMTTPRANALWERVRNLSLPAWADAVGRMLVDSRAPTRRSVDKAVDEADEAQRISRAARARATATMLPGRIPDDAPNRAYGQFRLDILRRVIAGEINHNEDLAEILRGAVAAEIFPDQRQLMVAEIAEIEDRLAGVAR